MDTSLLQGLALLETQDGAKSIKGPNGEDSYNLFNIKDNSGQGYRAYDKAEKSKDAYRVYGSREESIQDALKLFDNPRYASAKAALEVGDATAFAKGLKAGGYATDPLYVSKLTSTIDRARKTNPAPVVSEVNDAIQQSAAKGKPAFDQMLILRQNGWSADIDEAIAQGWKPEEIVNRIAGEARKSGADAFDARSSKGFLANAIEGVQDRGQQLVRGVRQGYNQITGDTQTSQTLSEQEAADRADPNKIALRNTAGATVGALAPEAASLLIPGGATVKGAALIGGALGAAAPTTGDESRLANTATGAALAGGGVAIPTVLTKSLGGAQSLMRGGKTVEEVNSKIAQREALGLSSSAADVGGGAASINKSVERVLGSNFGLAERQAARSDEIAQALAKGVGEDSKIIDSELISKASQRISKKYDSILDGYDIPTAGLAQDVSAIAQKSATQGLNTLRSPVVANVAKEIQALEQAGSIPARDMHAIRSQLGGEMQNGGLDGVSKNALKQIRDAVTNAIEQGLPSDALAQWKLVNSQQRNFYTLENAVKKSNDTGVISPTKLAGAVKGSGGKQYSRGDAAYQDLQKAVSEEGVIGSDLAGNMGGPSGAGIAQSLLGYATGGTSVVAAGITSNIARRIMTSTDPKIRAMVLGLNPVKQSELNRLALAGSLVANEQTQKSNSAIQAPTLATALAQYRQR
jgi:hypothetical protein